MVDEAGHLAIEYHAWQIGQLASFRGDMPVAHGVSATMFGRALTNALCKEPSAEKLLDGCSERSPCVSAENDNRAATVGGVAD